MNFLIILPRKHRKHIAGAKLASGRPGVIYSDIKIYVLKYKNRTLKASSTITGAPVATLLEPDQYKWLRMFLGRP